MAEKKVDFNAVFSSMKGTTPYQPPKSDIGGQLAAGALYDFPAGLAGMTGDVGRAQRDLARNYGLSIPIPGTIPGIEYVWEQLPSTQDVKDIITKTTGFSPRPYEELNTAEKYARTIGSFVPNILTSPQRMIATSAPKAVRAAANVGQRIANVVIPGAASEAAGQAFEGEGLEPYARVAGAMLGGRMASGKPSPQMAVKGSDVSLPKLAEQTNEAYTKLRSSGIAYDRKAFANALDDAAAEIKSGGIDSESVGRTISNLKAIGPNELDWTRLDTIRQNLSRVAYGANTSEADQLAAKLVLKRINELETSPNFYMRPGATPISQSDLESQTRQARELAARRIKTRQIDSIIELAPTYAGTPENNLRSGFRRLLRDIKRKDSVGWTKDEIAAIEDVAEGRKIVQALSKLSPSTREFALGAPTAVPAALGAGVAFGNPFAALAPSAVGIPARVMSGMRTQTAAQRAAGLVSAPRTSQQEAAAATEMARRGIAQRNILAAPAVLPGLLDEDRR